jgi:hypothetical protein
LSRGVLDNHFWAKILIFWYDLVMSKFNFKNKEDFLKIKEETEKFYHSIKEVRCPYFAEKIVFNAKGLRHLKFKSDQKARTQQEQYIRLKLLKLAGSCRLKATLNVKELAIWPQPV